MMSASGCDEKQRAEVIKKCREYFRSVDTNGDGRINAAEFVKMIDELGMNLDKKEMMQVYNRADMNGDGSITFNEFLESYSQQTSGGSGSNAANMFQRKTKTINPDKISENAILRGCKYFWKSDKDGDGRLNHTEFAHMLNMLGMDLDVRSVYRAFRIVDVDDNNYITFGEFARVYMNEIKPNSLTPDKIKRVFYACDKSRKGFITWREFQEAMCVFGNVLADDEASKLFNVAGGKDMKGKLTFQEYCEFMGLECEEGGRGVLRSKRSSSMDTTI